VAAWNVLSAAPDMLAALEAVVGNEKFPQEHPALCRRLESVIAKARGITQKY